MAEKIYFRENINLLKAILNSYALKYDTQVADSVIGTFYKVLNVRGNNADAEVVLCIASGFVV